MSNHLKPCPFCGGDASFNEHTDDCYFTVLHKLKSDPPADLSRVPDLIEAWNTRTAIQQAEPKHRHWSEALADDLTESGDIQTNAHPAPGVPVGQAPSVWNSIQIASWIGSQLMREPSMFERNAVCKFVRSLGRHPTLLKHSPKDTHHAPGVPEDVARDAQRYRWLRRKACVIGKTTYCGEETGQPILDFVNLPDVTEVIRRDSASTLDAAIDAAILAARAQKGGG